MFSSSTLIALDRDPALELDPVVAGDERRVDRLEAAAEDGEPAVLDLEAGAGVRVVDRPGAGRDEAFGSVAVVICKPPLMTMQLLLLQQSYRKHVALSTIVRVQLTSMATTAAPAISLNDEELAAWRAFLRAHSTMLRRISRDLDEADLPPLTWYDVLAALRDAPERQLRQVELAERVLLSNSGLSRLIDRIEKRRAGAADEPATRTGAASTSSSPTTGREMLERMWPVYARGIAEDFLPALGSEPVRDPRDARVDRRAVRRGARGGGRGRGATRLAPQPAGRRRSRRTCACRGTGGPWPTQQRASARARRAAWPSAGSAPGRG